MDEKDKIVITGCTLCRKHFGTVEQFKRHINEDVLPPLLINFPARFPLLES
jgi:zinc finger double-stranded RNA-binding protein